MRSDALFKTLNHHAVISRGINTTCTEADRLCADSASHSTAALAPAGGGNQRKVPPLGWALGHSLGVTTENG